MGAAGYAIVALIFFGLGDFVFKRAADAGIKPHHFLMVQAAFFSTSVLTIGYATGVLIWAPAALWGALAGLFVFSGFYSFSRSLVDGPVSINAPLFRLNFMVTAALAIIILGEPLTLNKAFGLTAALVAAWLLVGGQIGPGAFAAPGAARSVLLALLGTLCFGLANFFHKVGLLHGILPGTMLAAQVIAFVSLTFLSTFAIERRIAPPRACWKYSFAAAVALLVAFYALLWGLAAGEASVVVPIAQMGFIVSAALGITVLRERITVRKMLGLAAAAAALLAFVL